MVKKVTKKRSEEENTGKKSLSKFLYELLVALLWLLFAVILFTFFFNKHIIPFFSFQMQWHKDCRHQCKKKIQLKQGAQINVRENIHLCWKNENLVNLLSF